VTAIGRATVPVMPRGHAPDAEYILDDGFLLCLKCRRWMEPAPRLDGTRAYWCGPPCCQRDLLAGPLESRLELAALTRAITTLHPDLARVQHISAESLADLVGGQEPEVDPDEVRRWQACGWSDRRALVRTGYVRVEVAGGAIHGVLLVRRDGGGES